MDEVNHTDRTIYRHSIGSLLASSASSNSSAGAAGGGAGAGGGGAGATADSLLRAPSDDLIAKKLTQPTFVTYLDTDKIEFAK